MGPRNWLTLSILFVFTLSLSSQVLITEETFDEGNGAIEGTMLNGEPWDASSFNNCSGGGTWSIQNGWFEVEAMEGFNCCECFPGGGGAGCGDSGNTITFGPIDISGYSGISIFFDFNAIGNMECSYTDFPPFQDCPDQPGPLCDGGNDQAIFSYSIDGQPDVVFAYWCGDQFCLGTDFICGLNIGNSLIINIQAGTQASGEIYRFDDIQVFGYTQTLVTAEANGNDNSNGPVDVCFGESLQLNEVAGQAAFWRWSGPADFSSFAQGPLITNVDSDNSGVYTVTIEDDQGCNFSDTIEVLVSDSIPLLDPLISIPCSEETNAWDLTQYDEVVNGESEETVTWYDGDPTSTGTAIADPTSTNLNAVDLWVVVGDPDDCFVADSIIIEVICPQEVYIPNAFSPNGDGINDIFTLHTDQDLFIKRLEIYNRWGNRVFQVLDQKISKFEGWAGLIGAKEAQEGVYTYYVELESVGGHIELYKGEIMLVK